MPQGHEISKSAKKKCFASFRHHFSIFLFYASNMVAPRHVMATDNLEERMEKARLKFERMQQEVQEHQEGLCCELLNAQNGIRSENEFRHTTTKMLCEEAD